eukprot:747829-Prymnesium_polylepis.1
MPSSLERRRKRQAEQKKEMRAVAAAAAGRKAGINVRPREEGSRKPRLTSRLTPYFTSRLASPRCSNDNTCDAHGRACAPCLQQSSPTAR